MTMLEVETLQAAWRNQLASMLIAAGSIGCASPGTRVDFGDVADVPRRGGDVVTLVDLMEAGHAGALAFARSRAVGIEELLARFEPWCVRIEAREGRHENAFALQGGSGLLLAGGEWVLTAGHVLAGDALEPWVVLADGRAFRARLRERVDHSEWLGAEDWALLEIPGGTGERGWQGEVAAPRRGTLALALGYPGGNLGRDASGEVARAQPARNGRAAPLAPMVMVARVARGARAGPVELAPIAGPLVQGGMSGGPIVDLEGRLLGVLSTSGEEQARSGVIHSSTGSDWASLRARLTSLFAAGGGS